MTRRVAYLLAALLLYSASGLTQPEESTLPLDRFRPTMDTSGFAVTEGGGIPGHLELQAGLIFDYALNPLVVREQPSKRVVEALVQNRLASNLLFTIGLFEYVSLGVDLPVLLFQNASTLENIGGVSGVRDGLAALGIGDLKLVPKIRVLRQDRHFVNLSLVTAVTLPTATGLNFANGFALDYGTSYLGEGPAAFSIIPELILSADYGGVRGAVNLAYRLRPPIYFETPRGSVVINPEIAYRAGLGYDLSAMAGLPKVLLFAELFGATADRDPFGLVSRGEDPTLHQQERSLSNALEWAAGARWALPVTDLHVEAGVGSGILSGFGSPDLRVFTGLRWAPLKRDRDGDGIPDDVDACPDEPEDFDGFQDTDGCPDLDNDGDGIPDHLDLCPDEPEDVDGFQDADGCPDPDNDGDGIPDVDDKCPDEPGPVDTQGCPIRDRDQDGIRDEDDRCPDEPGPASSGGCPLNDRDGDGVLDEDDKCPDERGPPDRDGCPIPDRDGDGVEDKDDACPDEPGPAMFKGCPDRDGDGIPDKDDRCPDDAGPAMFKGCPDRDGDGIPDIDDKCPDEPETINGFQDEDGCPDEGKVIVVVTREKIEIGETVHFQTGSARIQRRSFSLLNQVAQVLRANPQIKRVRVEGHTDSVGRDAVNKRLSQARAESVRRYLIERGVEEARLEAVGYGREQPIAPNDTAAGRAQNRRVEFVILEQ